LTAAYFVAEHGRFSRFAVANWIDLTVVGRWSFLISICRFRSTGLWQSLGCANETGAPGVGREDLSGVVVW